MFKISKTGWTILIVSILVIALGSLGMAYIQQNSEQDRLEAAISEATVELDEFILDEHHADRDALEKRLSQMLSEHEAAKGVLSPAIESIDITGDLFRIAELCNVEIVKISSSPFSENDVNGLNFYVLPIKIDVEGEITDIIEYLNKLDSDFTTGFVESVETSVPEAGSGEETSASIQIKMYTYGG